MAKEVKRIKFGFWERNFSLLNIGTKVTSQALKQYFTSSKLDTKTFLKITNEFSELKGSLMKAGQLLSLYGESFLPKEIIELFNSLQDQSSYVRFRSLKKHIKKKDQEKLNCFKIKDKPFASASIGQVHLGKEVKTGEEYAIKIQYPNIEKSISNDLKVLKFVLASFKVLPKKLKLDDLFIEIEKVLNKEIDYVAERKSQSLFRSNLPKKFLVPKSLAKYSSKSVLVSQYLPGTDIDDIELNQDERNKLGEDLLELLLYELFIIQHVQTDPNPANFKIDQDQKKWILYDFGACLEVEDSIKKQYIQMIKALMNFDSKKILKIFESIGIYQKNDKKKYKDDLIKYTKIVSEVFEVDQFDWKENDLEEKLIPIGRSLLLNFPRSTPPFETSFIDRKISGTFFLLKKLRAQTRTNELFNNFFKEHNL